MCNAMIWDGVGVIFFNYKGSSMENTCVHISWTLLLGGANEQLKLFYKLKGADATYSLHQVGLCPSSLAKGIQ